MDKNISEQEAQEMPVDDSSDCAGFFSVVFLVAITFVLLSVLLPRPREAIHHASINHNLKQWGLIFKMYANESPGEQYPPLTQYDDLWVPDLNVLYPEYSIQPQALTDSGNYYLGNRINNVMEQDPPDLDEAMQLMAQTYVYPGWAVQKTFEVDLMKLVREGRIYEGDYNEDNMYLWWMREGVERYFITDIYNPDASPIIRSKIPVLLARPRYEKCDFYENFSWWRYYLNMHLQDKPRRIVIPVLFLDGHVEMMPQDDAPEYIKALVELFPEPIEDNQDNEN